MAQKRVGHKDAYDVKARELRNLANSFLLFIV